MVLWGVAPGVLGMGIIGTSIYFRSLELGVPLWFGRQLFRLIILGVFSNLMLGYCTMRRDMVVTERGQLLHNIQRELDSDRDQKSR